jgi:uncharacterized glyoxalase superfamily protein PhnB
MPPPVIVSAVSRFLAVSDLGSTSRFYRDTLGFEEKPGSESLSVEFVRGPARIVAKVGDMSFDSTGDPQPRGSGIVFVQVDDVEALRAEIVGKGGKPSPLEKANWLKMRLFELRDPDGHTIWFGQSYHVDLEPRHVPEGKGQLREMLPHLPLNDVAAGIAYYKDVLGFSINYAQHNLGVMFRDSGTLLLMARTPSHTGIGSCTAYVSDADKLYVELAAKGAKMQGAPVSQPWGLRDFSVTDLEGNRITFAQPFE